MQIAIASGKGGTGKTTMSLAISTHLSRNGYSVNLLDCDVEEPNAGLFLSSDSLKETRVTVEIPLIDKDKCIGCGVCEKICQYNALAVIKEKALLFPELCHSCGGCILACSTGAISGTDMEIGSIFSGTKDKLNHITGKLDIGKIQTPMIISEVKDMKKDHKGQINIIDSPPGNSCPMIEAVRDCNYVLLVAEPTPFSMNDLEIALDTLERMNIDHSVIINKAQSEENILSELLKKRGTDIAASFSESRDLASAYSKGDFVDYFLNSEEQQFKKIEEKISTKMKGEMK